MTKQERLTIVHQLALFEGMKDRLAGTSIGDEASYLAFRLRISYQEADAKIREVRNGG